MDVVICRDADQVGRVAADFVIEHLEGSTTPVIGLATGSSPLALYADLARRAEAGEFDFSKVQLAFFAAGPAVTLSFAARAAAAGCSLIDLSGALPADQAPLL